MAGCVYGGSSLNFVMDGVRYVLSSPRVVKKDELEGMLFHVRRMLGYIVYPRWFTLRIFLSEVIEELKKNNFYKREVKNSVKKVLAVFDELERKHKDGFDQEFIEIMAASLTGKSLAKINDIRGSIGGVLMNYGVKKYPLYSYPYTFVNLCYDNILTFKFSMIKAKEIYGIDFTSVFSHLRGDAVYLQALKLMSAFIKAAGEDISGVRFKDSNCLDKFETLNNIMSNENNLRSAFKEALDEMPKEKVKMLTEGMSLYDEESDNIASKLSEKFNVKRSKK